METTVTDRQVHYRGESNPRPAPKSGLNILTFLEEFSSSYGIVVGGGGGGRGVAKWDGVSNSQNEEPG